MARPSGVVSIGDSLPIPPSTPDAVTEQQPAPAQTTVDTAPPPPTTPEPVSAPVDHMADLPKDIPPLPPTPTDGPISGSPPADDEPDEPAPEPKKKSDEPREVIAERVDLPLDLVKQTEFKGNIVLDMSVEQRSAYDREVGEVRAKISSAEKGYVMAQWYMGAAAQKLHKDADAGGTVYGKATIEGFAHDIGRDKSTVYKAMKLAKALPFGSAQHLKVTFEAFTVVNRLSDKARDFVLADFVERCKGGAELTTEQVERVVETLLNYPSLVDGDKKAVTKIIDGVLDWEPKQLPGKDRPAFTADDAKKIVKAEAPKLMETVKADEKSAANADKSKRGEPGVNSKTGQSHVAVAKAYVKALDTLIEKAGSLVISMKEADGDGEMSDKAFDNFAEQVKDISEKAQEAIPVLEGIVKASDAILEDDTAPAKAVKKKKAKARTAKKK